MDQEIISICKTYNLRLFFRWAIDTKTEDHAISLADFWMKYNIKHAHKIMRASGKKE